MASPPPLALVGLSVALVGLSVALVGLSVALVGLSVALVSLMLSFDRLSVALVGCGLPLSLGAGLGLADLGVYLTLLVAALSLSTFQNLAAVSIMLSELHASVTLDSQPVTFLGGSLPLVGSPVAFVGSPVALVGLPVAGGPADFRLGVDLTLLGVLVGAEIVVRFASHTPR